MLSFKVKVSSRETPYDVTIPETSTVLELKNKLSGKDYEDVPVNRLRLIYSGRVLKDNAPLSQYTIKPGNTIHLVKSAASAPTPSSSSQDPAVPTNISAGIEANNPLAGLTGARYAGQVNLPNRSMFGADGGVRNQDILPVVSYYLFQNGNPRTRVTQTGRFLWWHFLTIFQL